MGIAALVLGIISLILAFTGCGAWISWLTALIGLILGIVAVVKGKKSGDKIGMGVAGIILSAIATIVTIVVIVFSFIIGVAALDEASTSTSTYKYRTSYNTLKY